MSFAVPPRLHRPDLLVAVSVGTRDRGDPGSTYQHWQFTNVTSNTPETNNNPYGDPSFEFEEPGNWGWNPAMPGPDGPNVSAWTLQTESGTGTIILHVPNKPDPNEIKYIFLQMTSTKAPSPGGVTPVGGGSGGPYTAGTWNTGVPQWQEPNGWYTYNWGLTIEPNPEYEDIVITVPFGTSIDQIVVDTICTPEPATLALLLMGALLGLIKRSR